MRKFIFVFLWLGIVSNVFAMHLPYIELYFSSDVDLLREFSGKDECYKKIKEFKRLPFADINKIFRNPYFKIDTENSAFALLMVWADAQDEEKIAELTREAKRKFVDIDQREKFIQQGRRPILAEHVKSILPLIVFKKITKGYLLNVVSKIVKYLQLPELNEKYDLALVKSEQNICRIEAVSNIPTEISRLWGGGSEEALEYSLIFYEEKEETISIRAIFNDIDSWTREGELARKHYSQQMFSNGYSVYLWARLEKDDKSQAEYLALYLHLTDGDISKITHNQTMNVPVDIKIEVLEKNPHGDQNQILKKVVLSSSVNYNNAERSIGTKASHLEHDWKTITDSCKSPLVINNQITVIATITFKNL